MPSDAPHIAFTMKGDMVMDTLSMLGVTTPAMTRAAGGSEPLWPGREQWAPFTADLSERLHGLLSDPEREEIETVVSGLELSFDAWLGASRAAPDTAPDIGALRQIAGAVGAAEGLVCKSGSHAVLPYFVRWFMLEFAVTAALTERGAATEDNQLAAVQVWWRGRDYLQRAFQSAYADRAGRITLRRTGALGDRVFVHDAKSNAPLTIDVSSGGQDEIELRRVSAFLAAQAARDDIRELRIGDGARMLAQAHASIAVTARSSTRQDQLVDPLDFWHMLQASIDAEVDAARAACGSALDRLVIPAAFGPSEPGEAASASPSARAAPAEERAGLGWDLATTVVPGLAGMIPVVGPLVSIVLTTWFQLLGQINDKPDPFLLLEQKIEALIQDSIEFTDAQRVKNALTSYEKQVQELARDYYRAKQNTANFSPYEFRSRALSLLTNITTLQEDFSTPASGRFLAIAPSYMRYFIVYLCIMDMANTMGVTSFDLPARRRRLYQDTDVFVRQAIDGIARQRSDRIRIKNTSNGCSSDIVEIWDHRLNIALSVNLSATHPYFKGLAETVCRTAAGIASVMQVLRDMIREMDGVIRNDTAIVNISPTGFRPDTLSITYYNGLTLLNDQAKFNVEILSVSDKIHLLKGGIAELASTTKAQRSYLETALPRDGNILLMPQPAEGRLEAAPTAPDAIQIIPGA